MDIMGQKKTFWGVHEDEEEEVMITIENRAQYIPLDECKDGYFYCIHARNSNGGIFSEKEKGFIISRFKFGDNFLFTEYHWDTGEPYGTVKPIKEICKAPELNDDGETLEWLNQETEKLPDPWEE